MSNQFLYQFLSLSYCTIQLFRGQMAFIQHISALLYPGGASEGCGMLGTRTWRARE